MGVHRAQSTQLWLLLRGARPHHGKRASPVAGFYTPAGVRSASRRASVGVADEPGRLPGVYMDIRNAIPIMIPPRRRADPAARGEEDDGSQIDECDVRDNRCRQRQQHRNRGT